MSECKEPQIYIINNEAIGEVLDNEYTIVSENSMGVKKCLIINKTSEKYFSLTSTIIENLHEYKVVVIDLQNEDMIRYSSDNDQNNEYVYQVNYPKIDINIKPYAMKLISRGMDGKSLKIIFADQPLDEEYIKIQRTKNGLREISNESYNCYYGLEATAKKKIGKKFSLGKSKLPKIIKLSEVIEKYTIEYRCIFILPCYFENYKRVDDPNYTPLLLNNDGEVISYISTNEDGGYELFLPVCEDKPKLIKELFDGILSELFPHIFSESQNFAWINDDEFKPKELFELEEKGLELKNEYDKKIEALNKEKEEILGKYKFLNDLLIETGTLLVEAVKNYFLWLGFEKVELVDEKETDTLREDLQIIDGEDFFIIEVKGIGGTSTDAECSQIAKHRRRREKENLDKTIIPLYIVNHQRYKKPELRQNPPFNENQIDYAINDERGLLTTYQLYKQYRLIESGIFTKEETRECLKKIGLVNLIPSDLQFIGSVSEYFSKNNACILMIDNCIVNVGDFIWAYKDTWYKGKIESIQVDSKPCQTVSNGEVGIVLDIPLGKGYKLYIKKR